MPRPLYLRKHQKLRDALLAALVPGSLCPQPIDGIVCGQPMWPWQKLELGHDDATGGYLGLVHASCNHRAGAIKGNRLRAAARPPRRRKTRPVKVTSRVW